jgi:hypothetical protein
MSQQKIAQDIKDGEDKIMESMKLFSKDAKCADYIQNFKPEVQDKLTAYRSKLVEQQQEEMNQRLSKQLASVAQFENSMNSQLQDMMVKEIVGSFRQQFSSSKQLQEDSFQAAVNSLAGKETADPVVSHFNKALGEIGAADLLSATPNDKGSIVERLAATQQAKEQEFKAAFMVTAAEAAEVKKLTKAAKKGNSYDFAALDDASSKRLEELYTTINNKVGFCIPHEKSISDLKTVGCAQSDNYIETINQEISLAQAKLRNARLSAFAGAFA